MDDRVRREARRALAVLDAYLKAPWWRRLLYRFKRPSS